MDTLIYRDNTTYCNFKLPSGYRVTEIISREFISANVQKRFFSENLNFADGEIDWLQYFIKFWYYFKARRTIFLLIKECIASKTFTGI